MIYIGVDPGVAGGIAAIDADGRVIEIWKTPETRRDILNLFAVIGGKDAGGPCDRRATVERVNAGVFGHGKVGRMGVTSAFTFGRNVEALHMALVAADIPYDEVAPLKWQNTLGCRTKGDKNITKARAQELFPGTHFTHATADAALIAEYGRRVHGARFRF